MTTHRIIKIFDTTLRDGEQSPGASMNLTEKLEVAQALIDLGVDIIEAGFPIASPGDFEAVREIANNFRGSTICGLARCKEADIDRAWEALKQTETPRIHVFLATSAIHREFKLKMTPDRIVEEAIAGVKRAIGYCDDVEFSPEDAARTELDFLCRVVEAAIDAGATTVNIPDTVGYATPSQMGKVIATLVDRVPNIDKAVISVHCHNDLGLAVANSLAAVENGAGQIECTVNGIGERAGNCSLEEVVMAIKTRNDVLPFWIRHGVDQKFGGFFSSLDRDGTVIDTDKGCSFKIALLGTDRNARLQIGCGPIDPQHAADPFERGRRHRRVDFRRARCRIHDPQIGSIDIEYRRCAAIDQTYEDRQLLSHQQRGEGNAEYQSEELLTISRQHPDRDPVHGCGTLFAPRLLAGGKPRCFMLKQGGRLDPQVRRA